MKERKSIMLVISEGEIRTNTRDNWLALFHALGELPAVQLVGGELCHHLRQLVVRLLVCGAQLRPCLTIQQSSGGVDHVWR